MVSKLLSSLGMRCRLSGRAFIAVVLTGLMTLPAPVLSAKEMNVSVFAQPLYDGDADDLSEGIARDISVAIGSFEGFDVVDFDKATSVIDYHRRNATSPVGADEVERILESAKEYYFKFNYRKAREELKKGIGIINAEDGDAWKYGRSLLDAYLSLAIVSKSQGNMKEARAALRAALKLSPMLTLSEKDYPPSFISILNEIKNESRDHEVGSLKVVTKPPAIAVYINGISQGTTPFRMEGVPVGAYNIRISDPMYDSVERKVEVTAGSTTNVHERLKWRRKKAIRREREIATARAQVMLGLSMADVLKTDKAILVDVDSSEGGIYISVRILDREFRVGQIPIIARIDQSLSHYNREFKVVMDDIREQLSEDVAIDTSRKIDPPGVGDPLLLERRKRSLLRNPFFWGAIGVAAAGAIAGGVAAAMSGGSSDTGKVRVSFK
ncbi:MAG: PEGA domain-containing protein [Deltaproteobacteria bacterium]|jgi:tetratricopeptide (TPR) repeat protein|nr:PEGA domain-containing protein [Deltaproteobacteria bacterium]